MNDYLLDESDIDWPSVLEPWGWLLPDVFTIWFANRFGDIFIELDDMSIQMLDVGCGTIERIADSRDDFRHLIDDDDNAMDWLMIPLVDALGAAGKSLKSGYCYGYRLIPVLGGEYAVANSCVLPVHEHYGITAEIHRQIKDLPDGAQVTIEFSEE
ncbi:MAG: T6SS immunity protein Tdi1 domain-containing protein [Planctomycetota bacterium]